MLKIEENLVGEHIIPGVDTGIEMQKSEFTIQLTNSRAPVFDDVFVEVPVLDLMEDDNIKISLLKPREQESFLKFGQDKSSLHCPIKKRL